ncbi:tRNA (adenosine(37)-N6)-threonylcarbamoyltransferase complex dimerization subunit type 1 TsaB [Rubrivivax gelatinosus]|uniref:tRNA (Adenosine(37)-N6)-threonylcarbamoyltransferase complex dimerization subunit type 1 TsaB n=1 Tax=Rubrivivax gelatinosus TaxID=28068 RepID=A0ABS1DU43_RUBGE|nr:tRNA (adenosine(37)-N6)-threonylcarbamoyltransferase complex dimerization subunit type 1 TsaB [Rubrivivax gelatinosus]MBK1713557.1 tRNA (adenosine(37)-N6)-threonylcarbamoyltransferase complex dimerization subunit type 1 TsaB [Rubrivivax gelatinosus]
MPHPSPPRGAAARASHETARLLAFDTSTERMAVALVAPHGAWTADEPGGALASAALLPCVHALLARAGMALADLDAIAFGRGPGAFTGLRTSCAVAQGLAFGLGCPVLPLGSLLIVAEDARIQRAPQDAAFEVDVAMDARMEEVYAGRYRWTEGRWQELAAPALYTLEAFAAMAADGPGAVAGSALAAFGERLGLAPQRARVPTEHERAAALLRLAQAAHAAGEGVDAALALPLYLRDKVALTTREREAVRAARDAAAEAPR